MGCSLDHDHTEVLDPGMGNPGRIPRPRRSVPSSVQGLLGTFFTLGGWSAAQRSRRRNTPFGARTIHPRPLRCAVVGSVESQLTPSISSADRPRRPSGVRRPQLVARLDAVPPGGVALLVAPAGSGKSVLIDQWLATHTDAASCVIAVSERYNDAAVMAGAVLHGLSAAGVDTGDRLGALVPTGGESLGGTFLELLDDAVRRFPGELLVVVEDADLLTNAALISELGSVARWLPDNVRLVVSSRWDLPLPVSELRLRGALVELRGSDLDFDADCALALVRAVSGKALEDDLGTVLIERTDGWAAGLQLIAISLQGADDPRAALEEVAGTDRLLVEYLTAEVLDQQATSTREFLVQTSVLPWLSAPLCDAVTSGSGAREQLDLLWHRSVFVVPLDRSLDRLRYHHLFADLLRQELSPAAGRGRAAGATACGRLVPRQRSRGRGHRAVDRRPGVAARTRHRGGPWAGLLRTRRVSHPGGLARADRTRLGRCATGARDQPVGGTERREPLRVGPRDLPGHHPPPRSDTWRAGSSGRVVRVRRPRQPQRAGGHRSHHVGAGRSARPGPRGVDRLPRHRRQGQRRGDLVVHDGLRPVPPGAPRQCRALLDWTSDLPGMRYVVWRVNVLGLRALVHAWTGELRQADRVAREALAEADAVGISLHVALSSAYLALGVVSLERHDISAASAALEESGVRTRRNRGQTLRRVAAPARRATRGSDRRRPTGAGSAPLPGCRITARRVAQ